MVGKEAQDHHIGDVQYLTAARRKDSEEHKDKTYHSLVLHGKLRTSVRCIIDWEKGGGA